MLKTEYNKNEKKKQYKLLQPDAYLQPSRRSKAHILNICKKEQKPIENLVKHIRNGTLLRK